MELESFACRLCLFGLGRKVNLFNPDLLLNVDLLSWINLTFGLKISETDGLPKDVCLNCLLTVYQTYFFIRRCQESESTLWQKSELGASAGCIIFSPRNTTGSDLSRADGLKCAAKPFSATEKHVLKQNNGIGRTPFRSNNVFDELTVAGVNFDYMSPFVDECMQNSRRTDDFCAKPCKSNFKHKEKSIVDELKNAGVSNSQHRRNVGVMKSIEIESLSDKHCKSKEGTSRSKTFSPSLIHKWVDCSQNSRNSSVRPKSQDKECSSSFDAEFLKVSEERMLSSANDDDISILETCPSTMDKKSDFHLEFVKFLNANVSQQEILTDICNAYDFANLQKDTVINHGRTPEELIPLLRNRGKDASKDSSPVWSQENIPSIALGRVKLDTLLDDNKGRQVAPMNPDVKEAYYANCSVKSMCGNTVDDSCSSEEILILPPSMHEVNAGKLENPRNVCVSSPGDIECVSLESPCGQPNVDNHNSGTESKATAISKGKICIRKTYLSSSTIQTCDSFKGSQCKSDRKKNKRIKSLSHVKVTQNLMVGDNSKVQHMVVGENGNEINLKPSLLDENGYSMEPECSRAPLNSSSSKKLLHLCPAKKDANTPSCQSLSCPDLPLKQMLEGGHCGRILNDGIKSFCENNRADLKHEITSCSRVLRENESSHSIKDVRNRILGCNLQPVCVADLSGHKKVSINRMSISPVLNGKSPLVESENLQLPEESIQSISEAQNELKNSQRPHSSGESNVIISTEKEISNGDTSNITFKENESREKFEESPCSSNVFLGSEETGALSKSSKQSVSSCGQATSVDSSHEDAYQKSFNHNCVAEPSNSTNIDSFPSPVQRVKKRIRSSKLNGQLRNKKQKLNHKSLDKKNEVIPKRVTKVRRKRNIKVSVNNFPCSFPCPACCKIFLEHDLLLKHLLTHPEPETYGERSVLPCSQLTETIPKSPGKLKQVDGSKINQHQKIELGTCIAVGAVKDEKIAEVKAIIQQHLMVNDKTTLSHGGKTYRCPACFKFFSYWFEVTSHIVLNHANLSSEWPISFLFSNEIFQKLTGKCIEEPKPGGSITLPPQLQISVIHSFNVCKHCGEPYSSKSALLKHLIWAHNK